MLTSRCLRQLLGKHSHRRLGVVETKLLEANVADDWVEASAKELRIPVCGALLLHVIGITTVKLSGGPKLSELLERHRIGAAHFELARAQPLDRFGGLRWIGCTRRRLEQPRGELQVSSLSQLLG